MIICQMRMIKWINGIKKSKVLERWLARGNKISPSWDTTNRRKRTAAVGWSGKTVVRTVTCCWFDGLARTFAGRFFRSLDAAVLQPAAAASAQRAPIALLVEL